MYKIEVKKLIKNFGYRKVLQDVSFNLESGQSLAITGNNGSGKTTLLRLLAGLISPTRGEILFSANDTNLDKDSIRNLISYVGPEMALYDALTAEENLGFFAKMRSIKKNKPDITSILDEIGLHNRGRDKYGAYSSGMKQRLKYGVALLNNPVFLFLDEPTSNLDDEGKEIVANIIERQKTNGILIIATNEKEEHGFARKQYQLGN